MQSNAAVRSWLCWAVDEHPRTAGDVNGDSFVAHGDEDTFLIAVMDGLGHGTHALEAAQAAAPCFVAADALTAPLEQLMLRAHEAARGTRGVVVTLVRVQREPLAVESVAVGNVDGVLKGGAGRRERIFLAGGVVGFRIPKLRTFSARVDEPLVIALATDGVDSAFASDPLLEGPFDVERTVELLLARHSAKNDDALALVARVERSSAAPRSA